MAIDVDWNTFRRYFWNSLNERFIIMKTRLAIRVVMGILSVFWISKGEVAGGYLALVLGELIIINGYLGVIKNDKQ